MSCQSKWCTWITALSQLAVAAVLVYAGLVVNTHMESWSESFKQGSRDLHAIREDMDEIAYSMESMNRDMDVVNKQLDYMNHNVGGIERRFSPQGMMRSMMPF